MKPKTKTTNTKRSKRTQKRNQIKQN